MNFATARLAWGELNPTVADLHVIMVVSNDPMLNDTDFVRLCVEAADTCGLAQGLLLPLIPSAGFASTTLLERNASMEHVAFGPVALERYARGPGWGLWLTEAHLEGLGGRDRVLREAPVAKVVKKSAGVWLELTPSVWDFSEEELDRLHAYLAPITPTIEQLRSTDAQWPWPRPMVEAPSVADEYADYRGASVAFEWLWPRGDDTLPINVHLTRTPSRAAAAALGRAVRAWYAAGVEGAYGGHFHDLAGPTHQGRVVSWNLDMRSVEIQRAADDLGRRLAGWAARWRTRITIVRFGAEHT